MIQSNQTGVSRAPSFRDLRAERIRLGARVREIRLQKGVKFRTHLVKRMEQQLGQGLALSRNRLRVIEDTGNLSAIELKLLSVTLDCPIDSFFEQPYGQNPVDY
jgi:transcriptional regulator with XRE-family HTH domain